MAAFVLIANGCIHIESMVMATVLAFMNALDANGSLLSRQEFQSTVVNCHSGNGFWQFILKKDACE
jgi:hypothetical protein